MDTQLILALKNNKLLKNIDLSKINLDQVKGELLTVQEGEIIYREGHQSDSIYLVVSGEVNLLKKKLLGKTKSVVFYDNDYFGYEEFIEGTKRTSTTVALKDSYVIKLSKMEVDSLAEQEGLILEHLKDPSLTEDFEVSAEITPEPQADIAPDESKEELTSEDFNISEEDFKIPDDIQSTLDSALDEIEDDVLDNVEEEVESMINNSEAVDENQNEEFSLDEQAFADSLKDKEDDVFFSIDDIESLDANEETNLNGGIEEDAAAPEPELNAEENEEIKESTEVEIPQDSINENNFEELQENIQEIPEGSDQETEGQEVIDTPEDELNNNIEIPEEPELNPDDFSAQPYQAAGAYKAPEQNKPAEELDITEQESSVNSSEEQNLENDFNFEDNYAGDLSKEDEEFFANLAADSDQTFESPSVEENKYEEPIQQEDQNDVSDFSDESQVVADNDEPDINSAGQHAIPDFDDFPPGLLDDDGIPKPEGEIPDDFNFDHETVEPIEAESNENMFEVNESDPEPAAEENIDAPLEELDSVLNEDTEKVTYDFNNDSIDITEDNVNDDINLDETMESAEEPPANFEDEFKSEEEIEAEENLKKLEEKKVEEINEASSTEDGHMTADQLMMINKAAQLVNSNIKLDDVLSNIVDVATNLTNADRGTLYLVDKEKDELWSKVAMGDELKQIRLTIGEGIAGWVAKSGEIVNIQDVKADSRFKSDYDKSSGYQTNTMLCFPIKNKEEEIVGVVQLLNSKNGQFSALDETFLSALSIHAALALENANLVEKLLQTERVSSLGKMANFLIQDIKKPVLVSKRYAEHLRSKEFPEDIYQVIDMLMEQLNHVADIVQTTSSYSQGTSVLRTVNTSLNQLLDDYYGRIESLVTTRNCTVMKEYGDDVKVKVDIKEFNQCYAHIIKNACDAMPEGGTITVSTRKEGNNVKISFKDYGLGIPDTMKEKIFEPFMSHGKKEGTGLGLSITKKLVEDHGGSIEVNSELGEGAEFVITLPVASAF